MVLGIHVDYLPYSVILSPMKINRVLSVSYYSTLKYTRNQVKTTNYSSHQTNPLSFPYCIVPTTQDIKQTHRVSRIISQPLLKPSNKPIKFLILYHIIEHKPLFYCNPTFNPSSKPLSNPSRNPPATCPVICPATTH